MPRRYPEYTPERIKESKSYQVLLPKFNARRWAFGSSEWQDHGVDYSFEYVQDGFFHGFRLLGQVKGSQPFVLFVVDLISATAYYLPLQDYFIANRDKYEKLKVNTSTISVRIPTRNTVSYADDDFVVVPKSCYCFDSYRDLIIKVR